MNKIKINIDRISKLYYNCFMENQMNGLPLNQLDALRRGSAPNQRSMEFGRHQRYRPVEQTIDGGLRERPIKLVQEET